jgi:hypothetical protein
MRRRQTYRTVTLLAYALREVERIQSMTTRVTDGRNLIITPGTTPGSTTPPVETSGHVLYGTKHLKALAVRVGAALSVDYDDGHVVVAGTYYSITAGNLGGLTNGATNYIFVNSAGAVASNTTGFPLDCAQLATATTAGGVVTVVVDYRAYVGSSHAGVTLSATADSNLLSLTGQVIGLDNQSPHYVFMGPIAAPAAAPSFRTLADSDMPSVYLKADGTVALSANWNPGAHTIGNYDFTANPATWHVGDANYWATVIGGNPYLSFDTNDFLTYDRASNAYAAFVSSAEIANLKPAGLLVHGGLTVDGTAHTDYSRYGSTFTPTLSSDTPPTAGDIVGVSVSSTAIGKNWTGANPVVWGFNIFHMTGSTQEDGKGIGTFIGAQLESFIGNLKTGNTMPAVYGAEVVCGFYGAAACGTILEARTLSVRAPGYYGGASVGTITNAVSLMLEEPTLGGTSNRFIDFRPNGLAVTNFYIATLSGDPLLNFDTNDYLTYNKASNFYQLKIGSAEIVRIDATGLAILKGSAASYPLDVVGRASISAEVGFGGAPTAGVGLAFKGTLTAGGNAIGIRTYDATFSPGNGNSARAIFVGGTVYAAPGFAVSDAYGMWVYPFTKTGAGTVTNCYGIYISTPTIGSIRNLAMVADGRVYIRGSAASSILLDDVAVLAVESFRPDTAAMSVPGLNVLLDANPAGASASSFAGLHFEVRTDGTCAQNLTDPAALVGCTGLMRHSGTGIVTGMISFDASSYIGAAGNATAITGLRIKSVYINSTGGVGTFAGLVLQDLSTKSGAGAGTITNALGIDIPFFATALAGYRIGLRCASPVVLTPSSSQMLAAGTTVLADAATIQITAASPITLTANPLIAAGQSGQELTIINVGANAIELNTNGMRYVGGGAAPTMVTNSTITFRYSTMLALWLETARAI